MKILNLVLALVILYSYNSRAQVNSDSTFVHHLIVNGVDSAQYIFEGEVISKSSYYNQALNFIYTSNTVQINQVWRNYNGKPIRSGDFVEVLTRGGAVGDTSLTISHSLTFVEGQKGMFLCDLTSRPSDPNTSTPSAINLEVYDELFFNYDFTNHFINASLVNFDYDCIELLYKTIDSTHVVECLDVFPNGFLQAIKFQDLENRNAERELIASAGTGGVTYTIENPSSSNSGGQEWFEFDIFISSTQDVFFEAGGVFISYNSNAFGSNIVQNSNVTVQRGEVIASISDYSNPMPNDNLSQNNLFTVLAGANEGNVQRTVIGSTPQQLFHVKIEINNCSELPNLNFENQQAMVLFSFYYDLADVNYTTLRTFDSIVANDSENSALCGMSIAGFTPSIITGGTEEILTITGSGFGTTPATVQMKSADDGGTDWLALDEWDIVFWNDTEIKVRVPSTGPLFGSVSDPVWTPGSGKIKVINSDGDIDITDTELIISYSWQNINAPFTPLKEEVILAGRDSVFYQNPAELDLGYLIVPDQEILEDTAKYNAFERAMNEWSCATDISWQLADYSTTQAYIEDSISTVSFGTPGNPMAIAETRTWKARCSSEPSDPDGQIAFLFDIDIVFSNSSNYDWFYDNTSTLNLPANKVDFYAIALHELGHAHLLMHVNQEEDLMYFQYSEENFVVPVNDRRIYLSNENIQGGTEIVNHSVNTSFDYCNVSNTYSHQSFDINDCTIALSSDFNKENSNSLFNVYPNPFNNQIKIDADLTHKFRTLEIRVFDLNGRSLYSSILDSNSNRTINLRDLKSGIYIMKVIAGNINSSYKIVKL